ncbi:MAG: DNA repair protein RecN [Clostridia bacterium]|nr:DNA repair protein RecN [Clostridia bacterium]
MILSLKLKNIALIESAEIEFNKGLNVLSGETGAGKTVIISAVNFALGGKADKTMIRHNETFSEAEVTFDITGNADAKAVLDDYLIDCDDNIVVVKRRLTIEGKSVILVNGSSVTLTMLKTLTLALCDIYGQSEHYSLLVKANQLKVLDRFIGQSAQNLKDKIAPIINSINKLNSTLENVGGSERDREIKLDLLSYQINEIENANLVQGEEETLEERRKILHNIEKIGESLSIVNSVLTEDNQAIDMLSTAYGKLNSISNFSEEYSSLSERLYSVKAELSDISLEVENSLNALNFDEEENAKINERLDLIRSLKRKYGNSIEEILEFLSTIKLEYDALINYENIFNETNKKLEENYKKLNNLYQKLSILRREKSKEFSVNIESELKTLGMKSARFEISISTESDTKTLSTNGVDDVEFTFSANAGEPLKNMSKIISGGEMSRFMLAMKIVSVENSGTYVFDEIDSGISGEVAKIVAEKFSKLSKNIQIITISHLPQIVSFSDKSFKIEKTDDGSNTKTKVIPLDYEGKIKEIVRIIGGDGSELSLNHAKELIKKADDYKNVLN